MVNLKQKIIYCMALVVFMALGLGFGYFQTRFTTGLEVDNMSLLDYATSYVFTSTSDETVTASTKTYDVNVIYEDVYTVCGEVVHTTKTVYGTTMDKVKEEEKVYQEEKGLLYEIKAQGNTNIIYSRRMAQNCPNHFLVIWEEGKVNIYSIQGEDKKIVYMTISDINIDNLRQEIRTKVEKGTYINSKEELNKFIEDLES